MAKVNTKVYSYDFPENREIARGLRQGDMTTISRKTGYSRGHLTMIFKGTRKMPDTVRELATEIISTNINEAHKAKDALVAAT